MSELQKMGIKIDILPKGFPIGGQFILGGVRYAHIGNKKCVMIVYEDEVFQEFKA